MIGPNEVHVWYAELTATPEMLALLNDEERARAARFLGEAPREQFIAARATLRRLLGNLVGVAPEALRFGSTGNGKPILIDLPAEQAVPFNLSHSGQGMVLAVSREQEVGVDLEWLRPRETYREMAARYFTPREVASIMDLRSFYAIWTRKEAFLKALGLGLAGGLERFAVTADDPARLLHFDGDPSAGERWTLESLEPRDGAIAAVAVPAPGVQIVLHT
jgi:4'-phosphopantetheinyl transferase